MAIAGLGKEWRWLYPDRPNPYKKVDTRTAYNVATGETKTVRQVYEERAGGAPPSMVEGRESEVQQRERLTTRKDTGKRYGRYISIEFRSFEAAANYLYNNPGVSQTLQEQGFRYVQVGVAFKSSTEPGKNRNYPRQSKVVEGKRKIVGYGLRHAYISKPTSIQTATKTTNLYSKNVSKTEDYELGPNGRYFIMIYQKGEQ